MEVGHGPNWGCSAKGKKIVMLAQRDRGLTKQSKDRNITENIIE
jgi:hypothetical protein